LHVHRPSGSSPTDRSFTLAGSKREYFAALAMQGFIQAGPEVGKTPERGAQIAVMWADALLAELAKTDLA
jgi:hypothetical protein